jgi:hypothetical protein
MISDYQIPVPFLFNPLKHHLGFIREFINLKIDNPDAHRKDLVTELKHLGTSVMDVYTGSLSISNICNEVQEFLKKEKISSMESFSIWAGIKKNEYRIIVLSDNSQWTIKYKESDLRFVHIFPARYSQHTFRIKATTLKSAILYNIIIGKDFITVDDLNAVRARLGLSPVKNTIDTEAITELIEILRVQ